MRQCAEKARCEITVFLHGFIIIGNKKSVTYNGGGSRDRYCGHDIHGSRLIRHVYCARFHVALPIESVE